MRYMLVHIYYIYDTRDHVYVESTESEAVKAAAIKVKQLVPSAKGGGGEYGIKITHLYSAYLTAFWGLIRFFCDEGWEPFSTEGQGMWLRKREEG